MTKMFFAKHVSKLFGLSGPRFDRLYLVRFNGQFQKCKSSTTPSSTSSDFVKSLLYVPGDTANKLVSILKPAVTLDGLIDQPEKIDAMRANLVARGIELDVDLKSLLEEWTRLKKIRAELDVEQRAGDASSETTRQTLKELSKRCGRLEEATMPTILKLPNELHPRTPRSVMTIVRSHRDAPAFDFEVSGHEKLGQNTGTIVFRPNVGLNAYYFRGSMAWLELATIDYFRRCFEKSGNFVPFSNPDFTKSIVLEACDGNFQDPSRTFYLEREEDANPLLSVDLHLTGSASTKAFYAFHAKTRTQASNLALKYFASGQSYRPVDTQSSGGRNGLFGVSRASAVNFFVATSRMTPAEKSHDEMLALLQEAFENLHLHFRVIMVPASDLLLSESLRTEVQLWSPAGRTYHTVASVSCCDDFISRRLMMCTGSKFKKQSANENFLHVCHGTAVSVPQFLACVVENNQTKDRHFTTPAELQICVDRLKSTNYS